MNKTLKDHESFRTGIEIFAMAREWIHKPYESQVLKKSSKNKQSKKAIRKAGDLYLFLDEISSVVNSDKSNKKKKNTEAKETETLRKRYEPYLKKFCNNFSIDFNFQDKTLDASYEENHDKIYRICKSYIQEFADSFSDESLKLVINNWKIPGDLIYFLVVVRYSILLGFPIEFYYKKTMEENQIKRKIYPLAIYVIRGRLGVIGKDIKDKKIKSFMISRIESIEMDLEKSLFSHYSKENRIPFDINDYLKNDPYSRFNSEEITYKVEISERNLDFLRHTKNWKIKETSESSKKYTKIVLITTSEKLDLFDILFNFGIHVKILEPKKEVLEYVSEIEKILQKYNEN